MRIKFWWEIYNPEFMNEDNQNELGFELLCEWDVVTNITDFTDTVISMIAYDRLFELAVRISENTIAWFCISVKNQTSASTWPCTWT